MKDKKKKTLFKYGIQENLVEKIIEKGYSKTSIQNISIEKLKSDGFEINEINEIKEKLKRKPILEDVLIDLIFKCGFNCVLCSKSFPLVIHHIIPYEESQDNSFDNLVILCVEHHLGGAHAHYDTGIQNITPSILKNLKERRMNSYGTLTDQTRVDIKSNITDQFKFDKSDKYNEEFSRYSQTSSISLDKCSIALKYCKDGKIQLEKMDYGKAIEIYEDGLKKCDQDKSELYNNIGVANILNENISEAKISFEASIKVNPNNPSPYSNLALIYNSEKNYDKGIELVNKAINIDGEFAIAYGNKGLILINQNKYEEAEESLLRSIDLKPNLGENWNNLAIIYIKRNNNLEKALEFLNKGISHDPKNFNCLINKCRIHIDLDNIEEVEITFNKINKKIVPKELLDIYVWVEGILEFRKGNFDIAQKLFISLQGSKLISVRQINLYLKACEITIRFGGYNETCSSM
jgi:tetratricopeptide (TPR) repeat protein